MCLAFIAGCAPRVATIAAPTIDVPVRSVGSLPIATMPAEPAPDDGRAAGDLVEVEWKGSWWPAVLRERQGERWLIHYEGYGDDWDEAVPDERIRDRHSEEPEPEPLEEEELVP